MLSPNPAPDRHPDDPDVDLPDLTPPEPHRPLLDLSLTQLVGGSLAAATGAALASGLGVAGTILGAACVSLVSAIAAAAYTQSLRNTRARVRTVSERRPPTGARPGITPDRPASPPVRRRLRPQAILASAAAVFVIAFASITGYELLVGQPISGGTGGTTLNEVTGTGQAAGHTAGERDDPERDDPVGDNPTGEGTPTSTTTSGPSTGETSSSPPDTSSTQPGGSTSAPPSATDPTPTPTSPPSTSPAPTTPPASPTT